MGQALCAGWSMNPSLFVFPHQRRGGGFLGLFTFFWHRQVPNRKVQWIPLATCKAAILAANLGARESLLITVRCAASALLCVMRGA